jgi:hypothetical protein
MKKFNNPTDDFFRKSIRDYQVTPSEKAREAFLKDAMQLPPPDKKIRKGLITLVFMLLLSGIGIAIWFLADQKNITSSRKNQAGQTVENTPAAGKKSIAVTGIARAVKSSVINNQSAVKTNQSTINKTTILKQKTQHTTPQPDNTAHNNTKGFKDTPQPKGSEINKKESLPSEIRTQVVQDQLKSPVDPGITPAVTALPTVNSKDSESKPATGISASAASGTLSPGQGETQALNTASAGVKSRDTVLVPNIKHASPDPGYSKGMNSRTFYAGVYYTPEWMFNTLEGGKFVNNFGVEGTLHFGPFSIRTGAGISVTKGTNELSVEYNEYLGTYNNLDSMTFAWNGSAHQYIPKFYMTPQDVWDSLMKLDYPRVVKKYTYLQIPMIMGYDFWQSGRFYAGVRVGPILSILLSTKQLSEDYQPGNNRVIRINDITPEQESLNWQVMAGLSGGIQLSNVIRFEVEPSLKYYFNSVYEKPGTNWKPFSAGIRAAFMFRL